MGKGKITTDVASKYTHGLPHQIEQHLKCKLWALCDPSQHKKTTVNDELFVTADTGDIPKTLLE